MAKASPHHKSKKMLKYFEENIDIFIPENLPTGLCLLMGFDRTFLS
jgi:hypothetical protein